MRRILFLLIAWLVFLSAPNYAQESIDKYGKNRLQYKVFKWRFYSTENFDIYFYDGGNDIAREAAAFLEKEFDRITDVLGYAPYAKTKVFLYNSIIDLQQSNVGVSDRLMDIGGKTEFVKSQVEIAYPGTMDEFGQELIYQVSKMLINDMMFGGSLSDMFQSAYLLSLPEWFIAGASKFVAEGWSVEMDDAIRDIIDDTKARKLAKFTGDEAAFVGQSIWNFIAENYGYNYLSNILNLTRIIRNEERSISGTLGIPFRDFLVAWSQFYTTQKNIVDGSYIYPDKEKMMISNSRKNVSYRDVKLSPDGKYMAYASNNKGRFKVHVKRLDKNKEKIALRGGYKVINQEINEQHPLLSWRDDRTLGIIASKFGRNQMWMYDTESKKRVRKELSMVNNIKGFDIARNGNIAVISADKNGINDLYLVSLRRNSIKRITNDVFDDIHPRFIPGTTSIVFSSNRTSDTIFHKETGLEKVKNDYNLFIYNIDTTKNFVKRVTNTVSRDYMPMAVNDKEIYYISDIQGIYNLYKYNLATGIFHQVTNFGSSIMHFDISYDKEQFAFSMLRDQRQRIFMYNQYDLDQNIFTPPTRRLQLASAKLLATRRRKMQAEQASTRQGDGSGQSEEMPIQSGPIDIRATLADLANPPSEESSGRFDTDNFEFTTLNQSTEKDTTDVAPKSPQSGLGVTRQSTQPKEEERYADTDNYVFDTDVVRPPSEASTFLSDFRRLRRKSDIIGPLPYQSRFSADNVVTNFVVDPLIGFGINIQAQLNDELEDHRFLGGVLISTDLRSGNFFGEYRYLRHTVDFGARFDRRNLFRNVENSSQKYNFSKFELSASLPFSVTSRITIAPFYAQTNYIDLDLGTYAQPSPPANRGLGSAGYGGYRAEFTFDNTEVGGLNLIQGTRGRVSYIQYQGVGGNQKAFSNISLDFRNYQRVHREITFATRLFYGRFMGNNAPKYLLGGMDNWLFNQTEISGENDPLFLNRATDNSEILFTEFVTNLRGFNLNTFNGENSLLFNAELRLPIVQYFHRAPITSNFFKNLQLIAFYDIGSAWTGPSPFATENSVNTQVIKWEGSPFQARIKNFKNPWLSSYGAGLRTVLLGYYMKFDMAYPIIDYVVQPPAFYFTLGYDF